MLLLGKRELLSTLKRHMEHSINSVQLQKKATLSPEQTMAIPTGQHTFPEKYIPFSSVFSIFLVCPMKTRKSICVQTRDVCLIQNAP